MMKLPVKISLRHRGKVFGLDSEMETMTLLDPIGEPLGAVSWEAVIDFIQGYVKEARSHRAVRNYPRSRLAAKVRYLTRGETHFDSVTCEIGGGGVFIETHLPPQLGTALALELVLPDDPTAPISAQGTVAWVRPREEHYVFYPGIGVQFTEISEEGRARLLTMVKALDHARQGN
ncbi:MAG: PilZ domain-containing protein [Nitrospirota bacterium]|nr:PilZ domain-containing protein [Nitrospirota bacterium]